MSPAGGAAALAGGNAMAAANAELMPRDFAAIAAIMHSDARIELSEAKTTLVQSRLARRLREHGLSRFSEYVAMVQSDAQERHAMVVALTTNHTHFFREPHHFDHFREHVLPVLKRKQGPVRIWSAGCSSGEEVYTIAMCLLGPDRASANWLRNADVRLLATDIAPHVVESVQRGFYADNVASGVLEPYRSAWMRPAPGGFVMADEARQLVTARVLNLFDRWPLKAQYDVIFCRNVMIYFGDPAKEELEERFVNQLAHGGHLYIGHSERLIGPAARRMKSCGHTIYAKPETRG
ncbi:protein-glutamate O-methyltransferase CheR [Sphingomonas psychrotolerans]|uniref:Chemotaxis protein methyltransferase n=1 Tax=Sphingomonas psychrotolerans TaxID=1327635 RepID=A0ABU3MY96_9SPHN|nr:protein-glutamate O-methyltransferase CheR [Sphingomonas psychrotolerans]MDT8757088.1 protein-glutamate O-methyltransferase CheR [Sphingomonas psychrotolerans]